LLTSLAQIESSQRDASHAWDDERARLSQQIASLGEERDRFANTLAQLENSCTELTRNWNEERNGLSEKVIRLQQERDELEKSLSQLKQAQESAIREWSRERSELCQQAESIRSGRDAVVASLALLENRHRETERSLIVLAAETGRVRAKAEQWYKELADQKQQHEQECKALRKQMENQRKDGQAILDTLAHIELQNERNRHQWLDQQAAREGQFALDLERLVADLTRVCDEAAGLRAE